MNISKIPDGIAAFRSDASADDLTRERLLLLARTFNSHQSGNALKRRYYEGHIRLSEVNLGLALPNGMANLEIGCAWGEKAVDVLAARSMFDGFVGRDGAAADAMTKISNANGLIAEYSKATRNELTYGCDFATLSRDDRRGCRISWHSPETAAAIWSDEHDRIDCGLSVVQVRRHPETNRLEPTVLAFFDDTATWILQADRHGVWYGARQTHRIGRPLMVAMAWNATSAKPFGRSRLKAPVRNLIKGYVRTVANATIGLEFSTAPQKYLLGLTDDQYAKITSNKFQTYVGSILAATQNPETGENLTVGQLPQGSLTPHIDMIRTLATQFSSATGLTVTDVGIVNDANPTSSDAILAQSQTLILMAEQLNAGNGDALTVIAQMAQALARDVTPDELTEDERNVIPHFKNPAMPSVASMTDAALKLASARAGFAETDVFLEMAGFDQADIRRIKAQEQRARGRAVLEELEA